MKKLILTFFLIVLIVLLIKRKEHFFIQGCRVIDIKKPTENDFYQCFLDDINNYNRKLRANPTNSQVHKVKNLLGERIKNYFISLYIHGLEKDFRFIIAFVPSTFNRSTRGVEVIAQNIRMKDFMLGGYNQGRYRLKTRRSYGRKARFVKKVNYMGKKIYQVHGILVGMGFKIALSSRTNNFNGRKCSYMEYRPSRNMGYCIPGNFTTFSRYLKGGIYYDYRMLTYISKNPSYGGGIKLYEKETTKYIFRRRLAGHDGIGCGSRPEQRNFQFQRSLDSCMSNCYMRSRRGCHTAYGDTSIKEIYVIPDEHFFNLFYARNRKDDFLKNNTTALNAFHK